MFLCIDTHDPGSLGSQHLFLAILHPKATNNCAAGCSFVSSERVVLHWHLQCRSNLTVTENKEASAGQSLDMSGCLPEL